MSAEQIFFLHPGAAQDITDIWELSRMTILSPLVECAKIS
jgi:hypothetical protein